MIFDIHQYLRLKKIISKECCKFKCCKFKEPRPERSNNNLPDTKFSDHIKIKLLN